MELQVVQAQERVQQVEQVEERQALERVEEQEDQGMECEGNHPRQSSSRRQINCCHLGTDYRLG